MADDRIRELEIMIRLIDIEIILARRREGRQEQANRRRRRRRQVWTREWLNRRVMFGQYDTLLHELNREDFMCGCIYGLVRSHTVSHGLVRSLIRSYTDMAPVPVF